MKSFRLTEEQYAEHTARRARAAAAADGHDGIARGERFVVNDKPRTLGDTINADSAIREDAPVRGDARGPMSAPIANMEFVRGFGIPKPKEAMARAVKTPRGHRSGKASKRDGDYPVLTDVVMPAPYESEILSAVLALLETHPRVAFAFRQNTGAIRVDDRYVKFAFTGCSDILGMLKGGRFLAIELKRKGRDATPDQRAFLTNVVRNGGVGFVARSVDDVVAALK